MKPCPNHCGYSWSRTTTISRSSPDVPGTRGPSRHGLPFRHRRPDRPGPSPFDLVVLDYFLEDMKGSELLQTLHREGITTPVLMVTAYGDQQLAAQVLAQGALDYVVKDRSGAYLDELAQARRSNRSPAIDCSRPTTCSSPPSNRPATAS